jgi:hypothetical protein
MNLEFHVHRTRIIRYPTQPAASQSDVSTGCASSGNVRSVRQLIVDAAERE